MTSLDDSAPVGAPDNVLAAVLWMLVTTLLFVGVTGVVRHIGTDLPAAQAAFIRYAFGILLVLPMMGHMLRTPMSRGLFGLYASRGILHGFGVTLWFYAMARIPIAEVTALGYVAPIFVTIGAAIFLGEKLAVRRIAAVLVAFAGTMVILRPGFQSLGAGQIAQLIAACFFASSFLLTKRLTAFAGPSAIVFMLSIFCTLTLLPMALVNWVTPGIEDTAWLMVVAILATVGHYTMTRAIQAAPLAVTQPVSFLQLIWAVIVGIAIFDEPLDPYVIVGGAIVVGAATFISHREAVVARRRTTPPAPATKG